jgi:hypothetical protein
MKKTLIIFLLLFSSQILPQNITLRDTTNQYDYIIITIPEFVQSCQQFKQHKETVRDLKTLIVDTSQIYAEFNLDSLPQNNIREFISYAGSYWIEPQPLYILVVGTIVKIPNFTLIDIFTQNPHGMSDYDYMYNINNPDTTEINFLVGRIPAKNTEEIDYYFTKVIEYEKIVEPQPWMNNALFILQEDYNNYNINYGTNNYFDLLPSYIIPYYISNADTSNYYGNKDTIISRINNEGAAVVYFNGHGASDYFISPEYFSINHINELNNHSKYFVSLFQSHHGPILDTNTSITNEMIFLNGSGGLAGFAFVGLIYWNAAKTLMHNVIENIFNENKPALGNLISLPEFNTGTFYHFKKSLNLWGDPSIVLKYSTTTSVNNDISTVPNEYLLSQNYPNPFNPVTTIKYSIPQRSKVTLKVYDIIGKEISTLVNEEKPAAIYEAEFNASGLSSGVYFFQLNAGSFISTKKMILLR